VVGILRRNGIDISDHRSTMVKEDLLRKADLILTMEIGHAEALRLEFPDQAGKVFMLSEMTGKRFDIADPYGGPIEGYEHMVSDLIALIDQGLDRIIELARGAVSSEVQ
jgi:protein-tyrosine phosphatase